MASIPVPGAVMVELVYVVQGNRFENVYHVRCAGGADASDLTAIANVFDSWHNLTLRALMSVAYQLDLIDLKALDGPGAPVLTHAVSPARGGTMSIGGQIPLSGALAVRFTTGLTGRSFRGRVYHAGFGRDQLSTVTHVDPGYSNSLAAAYVTLKANLISAGYPLAIASKYSGIDGDGKPIPRAVGFLTNVTDVTCDARVDSQRRRMPRD